MAEPGRLNSFASVTLVGGAGVAKVGPGGARESWLPDGINVSVSVSGPITNEAQCTIEVGDANSRKLVETTFTGSSGDATGKVAQVVKYGEFIWATWTGGDTGKVATITVTGKKNVNG